MNDQTDQTDRTGQTIAILHPGEMGAAIAASLTARGVRTVWASAGRSGATGARAAQIADLGTLAAVVGAADVIVSVCPPHGALALAREVAGLGFTGVYIDANAIAPATTRLAEAAILANRGARFVDGGIIGPPPVKPGTTRLYLSGAAAAEAAAWLDGEPLAAIALDGPVGAASALKVCYAAWSKGSIALLGTIRAFAHHEKVDAALLAEWDRSSPGTARRSEAITGAAHKAWRWIAEMEEIAASLEAAGLPGGFHRAAADLYRSLEVCKDLREAPSIEAIVRQLLVEGIGVTR